MTMNKSRRASRLARPHVAYAMILAAATAFLANGCARTSDTIPATEFDSSRSAPPRLDLPEPFRDAVTRDPFPVRVQYVQETGEQVITTTAELVVTAHDLGLRRLPAGSWRISADARDATRFLYPVFVESFEHNEIRLRDAAVAQWRQRGYSPTITTLGRTITGTDGRTYDGRSYWLAVDRCATQAEADALKARLQRENIWSWTREEVAAAAGGVVTLRSVLDQTVLRAETPVTLRSEGLIALPDARKGRPPLAVPGPVEVSIDRTGAMALYGELPLEKYLQGILPAEVYPSWPLDALKAQAVAARSEIIVHAGGKHYFDGYDFCIEQHCRAYGGHAGEAESTNRAVADTAGEILIKADHTIVPTVFSSNCGGWTEHNENVWDGAADTALRGRPDAPVKGTNAGTFGENDVLQSLNGAPKAWCDQDKEYYRWTRSISLAQLSAKFDRDYGIGTLRKVETLARGVSGRLIAVQLVGSKKSHTIRKELNIRRAFENLPSALCTIAVTKGGVAVRGAGRGHGVGMCQHGACGMAMDGIAYDAILRHYFAGTSIAKL